LPSSLRITNGSSYGGSNTFSLFSPPSPPLSTASPLPAPERAALEAQLMKASMDCMGYMCAEVSLNHKRRTFLRLLEDADDIMDVQAGADAEAEEEQQTRERVRLAIDASANEVPSGDVGTYPNSTLSLR
jgi:hypothetical protein